MPLVTDSRGVQIYVDDDTALGMADELLDRVETIQRRSAQWGGQPSASDARRIGDDYTEAQRLVRDTGDVKATRVSDSDLSRFYQPGEAERILAERAQLRREAQVVTRAGALLGLKWTDRVLESSNGLLESPNTVLESSGNSVVAENEAVLAADQDGITVKAVEKSPGHWVVSDSRSYRYFTSRQAAVAEAAARRRVGWA